MLEVLEKDKCCGCSASFSACGHHAITMQLDSEGFEYPIISQEVCVDCGLCQSVCPVLQYENRKSIREKNSDAQIGFTARNKNYSQRLISSSGSIFPPIAESILDNNGLVVGAAYDKDFNVVHKFVESKVDSIYKLLPDYIKNHKFNSDSKRNISYFDDAEFIEQLESKISNNDLNIFTSIINKNADELGILKIYDKYAIDWDELFFDKLPEIKDNKQFVHIKYTYKELGISEEDLKIMKSILNHDEDLIKREILLVRD